LETDEWKGSTTIKKLRGGMAGCSLKLAPKRVVKEIQRISDGQKCGVSCEPFWLKKPKLIRNDVPRPPTLKSGIEDAAVQTKPFKFWRKPKPNEIIGLRLWKQMNGKAAPPSKN
jgi:hypothetical protein